MIRCSKNKDNKTNKKNHLKIGGSNEKRGLNIYEKLCSKYMLLDVLNQYIDYKQL